MTVDTGDNDDDDDDDDDDDAATFRPNHFFTDSPP